MLMDFDPGVRAVASQPFWLRWRDEDDHVLRHAPDFFARRHDGRAVVIDVRPDDRIPERDEQKFAVTAEVRVPSRRPPRGTRPGIGLEGLLAAAVDEASWWGAHLCPEFA